MAKKGKNGKKWQKLQKWQEWEKLQKGKNGKRKKGQTTPGYDRNRGKPWEGAMPGSTLAKAGPLQKITCLLTQGKKNNTHGGCLQMRNRLTVVAIVMEMVVVEDPPPLTHCPPLPLTER